MKSFLKRLIRLILGLLIFSLGIVITLKANIGYPPWDVFHAGIAQVTGLSIGVASIIVGFCVVGIVTALGEKIGFGTLVCIPVTGVLIDLLGKFIPTAENTFLGLVMLVIGLVIISLGSYFYLSSAFGAGPRDNLMIVLKRKTKLPVGICRSIVEVSAVIVGWALGGMVGIGTVISAFGIGLCIQVIFSIFRFDPSAVKHETIIQTFRRLVR